MKLSGASLVKLISVMLFACLLCIAMVGINAYSAQVQYEINTINNDIQSTQREIQNLDVKLKSSANVNNLEAKALELGLVYPSFDEIRYIDNETRDIEEFALALKENVYR